MNAKQRKTSKKFKVLFVGEPCVGKTSLLLKHVEGSFYKNYEATIGLDFITRIVGREEREVHLKFWDTAGQERFRSLMPSYFRDADLAAVVYDVTDENSFRKAAGWVGEVRSVGGDDVIVVLVGNKADLGGKRRVGRERGEEKAKELKAVFIETSAKDSSNVEQLFERIANELLARKKSLPGTQDKLLDDFNKIPKKVEKSICECCTIL